MAGKQRRRLSSGSFGPEAGLIGLSAVALGILMVLIWICLTRGTAAFHPAIAEYQRANDKEMP